MAAASANFAFLEDYDPQLVRLAGLAERYFADDPNGCLVKLRMFGELLATIVAARFGLMERLACRDQRDPCCDLPVTSQSVFLRSSAQASEIGLSFEDNRFLERGQGIRIRAFASSSVAANRRDTAAP